MAGPPNGDSPQRAPLRARSPTPAQPPPLPLPALAPPLYYYAKEVTASAPPIGQPRGTGHEELSADWMEVARRQREVEDKRAERRAGTAGAARARLAARPISDRRGEGTALKRQRHRRGKRALVVGDPRAPLEVGAPRGTEGGASGPPLCPATPVTAPHYSQYPTTAPSGPSAHPRVPNGPDTLPSTAPSDPSTAHTCSSHPVPTQDGVPISTLKLLPVTPISIQGVVLQTRFQSHQYPPLLQVSPVSIQGVVPVTPLQPTLLLVTPVPTQGVLPDTPDRKSVV